jgi:hypothetical protein
MIASQQKLLDALGIRRLAAEFLVGCIGSA